MATTQDDIRFWLGNAKKNHTHMIVVVDTFDYDDYPVYVSDTEDVQEVYDKYNGKNMQSVMEIYNLKMDIEKQLNEHRARNF